MDYCDEMRALRPVNQKLGNLRRHVVTETRTEGGDLIIRFESADPLEDFCLVLERVVDFVDRGTVSKPLTAGVVWKPLAEFGRSVAATAAALDPEELIEFRLDYETNGTLVCRFQAVAANARLAQ
ncbi:MAG: hypothetical protein AABO41_18475 [Acidobacteriota bacterium]